MCVAEKILVVDDHPVVLDGLVLILKDLMPQSTIITAGDGTSARRLANSHRDVDWIFLYVNLPDIDGIELLQCFDTMKLTANTIVLSSDSGPDTTDWALKNNSSGFL